LLHFSTPARAEKENDPAVLACIDLFEAGAGRSLTQAQ
jgi:hypothetical protein